MQAQVEEAKKKFLSLKPCCLDPYWSQPVQQKVASGEWDFKGAVQQYFKSFRPVSLREEQCHTIQRRIAGGEKSKALTSIRQRSQSVTFAIGKNFEARGGRALSRAKPSVAKNYHKVRKSQQTRFARPKQMGNTMIYFINSQVKQVGGSPEQHKAAWLNMPAEGKAWWRSRHHNSVQVKRAQQRMQDQWEAPRTATTTSWDLGDADWPVAASKVQDFVKTFQTKTRGMQNLQNMDSSHVQTYMQGVSAGNVVYHYKDAMVAYCKDYLGDVVNDEAVAACEVTDKIFRAELPRMGCASEHPGMCKTQHRCESKGVAAFFRLAPKRSCVLQFKTRRLIVYARSVLGWGQNMASFALVDVRGPFHVKIMVFSYRAGRHKEAPKIVLRPSGPSSNICAPRARSKLLVCIC